MRSTNVYEERSLGIFEDENDDIENEADYPATDSRVAIWGRYLSRHARRQLAFGALSTCQLAATPRSNDHCTDLWWLALAIFLVCIAEVRFFISPYPWALVNDQVRVGECVGLINLSNSAAS